MIVIVFVRRSFVPKWWRGGCGDIAGGGTLPAMASDEAKSAPAADAFAAAEEATYGAEIGVQVVVY